jgi:hypothetical protein
MIPAGRRVNDRRPGVAANGRKLPVMAVESSSRCHELVYHFDSDADRQAFSEWVEYMWENDTDDTPS